MKDQILYNRVQELETQLAFQEDTINSLNTLVYQQQRSISELEKVCQALIQKVGSISQHLKHDNHSGAEDHLDSAIEVPPHY